MALRFNLRITNVHRGLLLGTGPLVDPGFEGHLLIPLHNLTTNSYTFRAGERLIWVEFTKLSPNQDWNPEWKEPSDGSKYVPFPENKKQLEPDDYFEKAEPHRPIRSSIPHAMQEAKKAAEKAQRYAIGLTLGGIIGGAVLLVALRFSGYQLVQNSAALVEDVNSHLDNEFTVLRRDTNTELRTLDQQLSALHGNQEKTFATLKQKLNELSMQVETLRTRVKNLQSAHPVETQ